MASKWIEIFKQNPQTEKQKEDYFKRLADKEAVTHAYVKKKYWTLFKSKEEVEKTTSEKVDIDITASRDRIKIKDIQSKYNNLIKRLEESEHRYDVLLGIKEPISYHSIEPIFSTTKHEAIPIIMMSDWHFEEKVDPLTINGLNEYNLDIASERWNTCCQNGLKLVGIQRKTSDIKQMILSLTGDFITGYIHEELEESNYLSPTEATRFAKKKIITYIEFLLKHGGFDKITVVCNYGNHGRTNKKPRVSTSYKNSYEWMMYKDIEDYYSSNKKITFVVPNGMFAYVNTFDYVNRFFHGDSIQYGGGIGGLTVPLIKALHRYDQQTKADYNWMGHFHQLHQATKNCFINGSGIGFSSYAQRIGASPEDPVQCFGLMDSKYGLTIKAPIFCK